MSKQTWVELDSGDIRHMLTSLIGNRFGDRPEEHLDEIREERSRAQAGFYRSDPNDLPHLIQWNTVRGIKGIARTAGFKLRKRRGHKLLFIKK